MRGGGETSPVATSKPTNSPWPNESGGMDSLQPDRPPQPVSSAFLLRADHRVGPARRTQASTDLRPGRPPGRRSPAQVLRRSHRGQVHGRPGRQSRPPPAADGGVAGPHRHAVGTYFVSGDDSPLNSEEPVRAEYLIRARWPARLLVNQHAPSTNPRPGRAAVSVVTAAPLNYPFRMGLL
jgi:hypothetical protein